MKNFRSQLALGTLVASLAAGAVFAQTATPAAPDAASKARTEHRHRMMDPAQRQQRFDQRMTELKQKLQLSPGQENAWLGFAEAMRPSATPHQRPDREAIARMTTPERIDRMQAMQAKRQAEMSRRADATKAFYATLTPEQKKTFDDQSLQAMRGGRGHHRHG